MFTGIVESTGKIMRIESAGNNKVFTIASDLAPELKIDQSVCHNGVCLTVEKIELSKKEYQITAIHETLSKTTLNTWVSDDEINLERSVTLEQRLDGHLVQGHVDGVIECVNIDDKSGSHGITFELPSEALYLVIPQGSITLDGISLTVASLSGSFLTVAIIPYTMEHTNADSWKPGKSVNVEYDVFGKYLERYRTLTEKIKE